MVFLYLCPYVIKNPPHPPSRGYMGKGFLSRSEYEQIPITLDSDVFYFSYKYDHYFWNAYKKSPAAGFFEIS